MYRSYKFCILLLILVLFIIVSACSNEAQNKNKAKETFETEASDTFFTINFAKIIQQKREIPISEIAESVEYIPLENTKESILGNIMDVQLTKDYIFVKHNGSRLLTQFDRNGKFIRHIGREGRGPKEYGLMRMFSLDEQNQFIYIHTNWTHKVMVYNFDGEFIKKIQFGFSGRGFLTWSRDSLMVSFSEPQLGNEKYIFIETNARGDTLQTTGNHIFWDESEQNHFMVSYWGRNEFYRADDKLHMKGWYNDTVYTYNDENKFTPQFYIDLGKHKIPDDRVYERKSTQPLPAECYWVGVNESSGYVFIRYGDQFDPNKKNMQEHPQGCVLYNKKNKEGSALEARNGNVGFINDLNGGPHLTPRFSNDSLLFTDVAALNLKQYLESDEFKNQEVKYPEQKEELAQLNKTLKEDGNSFLMIAKLKE